MTDRMKRDYLNGAINQPRKISTQSVLRRVSMVLTSDRDLITVIIFPSVYQQSHSPNRSHSHTANKTILHRKGHAIICQNIRSYTHHCLYPKRTRPIEHHCSTRIYTIFYHFAPLLDTELELLLRSNTCDFVKLTTSKRFINAQARSRESTAIWPNLNMRIGGVTTTKPEFIECIWSLFVFQNISGFSHIKHSKCVIKLTQLHTSSVIVHGCRFITFLCFNATIFIILITSRLHGTGH